MNLDRNRAPVDQFKNDQEDQHQQFHLGFAAAVSSSSSSSASSRVFFNATSRDSMGYCSPKFYHHEDDHNYTYDQAGENDDKVKASQWKKKDQGLSLGEKDKNNNHLNWIMCSKLNKKSKQKTPRPPTSSSLETDFSSNSSPYISSNIPIRVCSDCNTTKTPLWRSGPKGPKSLCNACGIRQRKARRAMAAAAAAASGAVVPANEKPPAAMKIKEEKKKKMLKNGVMKKRCKAPAGGVGSSSSGGKKKSRLEEFLIKLNKKLAFQRVFPQDEKDAAILLMALSSDLLHG